MDYRLNYDTNLLIKEITDSDNGAGVDVSLTSLYDAIKNARTEDDPRLSMGVWERDLKKANWQLVQSLSIEILSNKSKDLQVVAWFIEAMINIDGFIGMPPALQFLKIFLESFWYTCFPNDNDKKIHILSWIEDKINTILLTRQFVEDVSLYDYEYALEMKALSKRSAEAEIEITQSAKRENRKSSDDIQNIIKRNDTNELRETIKNINTEIFLLLETINKILKNEDILTFSKVIENLTKINKIIAKREDIKEIKNDEYKKIDNNIDRNIIYTEIKKLSENLKKLEKHSPAPFILDLIVTWKNKSLFEIMNDLKEGNSEGHKLLKILIHN